MIDCYFKRPLILDYIISSLILTSAIVLYKKDLIELPSCDYSISIATDLSNISLTLSGFILTLLTVLITFKGGAKIKKDDYTDNDTIFDVFFTTGLYYETIKHLKNCVKSLIFISILGYSLKIGLHHRFIHLLFFYNIFGFAIIIFTLIRSLLILTKVINLQKTSE